MSSVSAAIYMVPKEDQWLPESWTSVTMGSSGMEKTVLLKQEIKLAPLIGSCNMGWNIKVFCLTFSSPEKKINYNFSSLSSSQNQDYVAMSLIIVC